MKAIENQFWKYVIPSMVTVLLGGTYAIVDGIFIGQGTGDLGLTAVNIIGPIAAIVTALASGIGMGGAIVTSTYAGCNDDKNVKKEVYYLPVLPQITCLAEGSKWNLDKSVLWKGILDLDAVERFSIFQISDLQRQYTVIRLDILESLLKRGARGIHITQMETVRGGESDDRRKRNN